MKKNFLFSLFAALTVMLAISSCKKEAREIVISNDRQMDEILTEYKLTDFLQLMQISEMFNTIHAYGSYAVFAPTNEAIAAHLQQMGKSSVSELSKEEAAEIIRYHLLHTLNESGKRDSVVTKTFVDGRMTYPTFAGKYLTTKQEGENIRINRQALILKPLDIAASNGHIHIIDRVLTPPDTVNETITARVRSLPDNFSIMKEAFERSGMAETLAQNTRGAWKTFFVQDNEAFAAAGIHNMESLLENLRTATPDVISDDTLLYRYIAYHTIPVLQYGADLLKASSYSSMVKDQVITFTREFGANETRILLNELKLGQVTEPGIPLNRTSEFSDWSCSNGVIQQIDGNIQIKIRSAYRIYWDIAEQPEIMALRNFRKPGCAAEFHSGELSEIDFKVKSGAPGGNDHIAYWCSAIPQTMASFDSKVQYVYNDALRFNLYSGCIQWMELKTPVLINNNPEGTSYKVWLCYRREMECNMKTTFKQEGYDDQVLPYIFNLSEYAPGTVETEPEAAELQGHKMYTAKASNSAMVSRLMGTIKVYTTGRHTLRLEPTTGGRNQQMGSVDMIHIIPVDESQIWPRVDMRGEWVYSDKKKCEIWPLEECPVDSAAIL